MENTPKEVLEARISDLCEQAKKGRIIVSKFLTPVERKIAERYLTHCGMENLSRFWGGYPQAERTCLILFPEYFESMEDCLPAPGENPSDFLEEADLPKAIEIKGSGFRTLSHRDYLGSLLALGLEREAIGDIAVQDEHSAVVFCTSAISRFLLDEVEYVASDKVKCRLYEMKPEFTDGRRYKEIFDTVASERLDCIVAALTNLSREAAQTLIKSKNVDVDFELEEHCDRTLSAPATLSIRGYGRFILRSFDGETKKGRLRLRAEQLV